MNEPTTKYVDHVSIVSKEDVTYGQEIVGKMGLKLREFPDGRYKLYMHVGVTLVHLDEGPIEDLDKAQHDLTKLKEQTTPALTWRADRCATK